MLKDDASEELRCCFYHEEIQKVGDKVVYRIKTVLQELRDVVCQKEYLVKRFGYTSRHLTVGYPPHNS